MASKRKAKLAVRKFTVELTEEEVCLLKEAVDSHRYWQLSDPFYRNSGEVMDPGSDDPTNRELITQCDLMESKLDGVLFGGH